MLLLVVVVVVVVVVSVFLLNTATANTTATATASTVSIHAVGNGYGCEATGVDVMHLSTEDFDTLHHALLSCKVLVIRHQVNLTVEGQRHFSQRFGRLHVHLESASHHEGYADVNLVSNIRNAQGSYIGLYGKHVENFHSDLSW